MAIVLIEIDRENNFCQNKEEKEGRRRVSMSAPMSKQAEAAAVNVEEVKSILMAVGLPVGYYDALEKLGLTSVVLLMSESGGALAQDPPYST